jgi:hypothetical protein
MHKSKHYEVIKQDLDFLVKELETDQVIETYADVEDAYDLASHLEAGGGFDSATPSFFVNNTCPAARKELEKIFGQLRI